MRDETPLTPAQKVAAGFMLSDIEFAILIGSSEKTLRNWRARGEGPAYTKLGRLVRYPAAAVQSFIEAGERAP